MKGDKSGISCGASAIKPTYTVLHACRERSQVNPPPNIAVLAFTPTILYGHGVSSSPSENMPCPHHKVRERELQLAPALSTCVVSTTEGGHVTRFGQKRVPLRRRTQSHPLVSLRPDTINAGGIRVNGSQHHIHASRQHTDAPGCACDLSTISSSRGKSRRTGGLSHVKRTAATITYFECDAW